MAKQLSDPYGPLGLIPAVLHPSEIDFGERHRQEYEDDGELEADILQYGIRQSLLVLQRENQKPLLIEGGRRYRIAEKHGLEMPVMISTRELDLLEIRTFELFENLHRKELSYPEKCALTEEIHNLQVAKYGRRMAGQPSVDEEGNKLGHSMADTAKMLGVDIATVSKDIKMAQAIHICPGLAQMKNQHEAQKALSKVIELHDRELKAEEVRKQLGSASAAKQHLASSYIVKDFFEGVKQIPDGHIDFVECDPYYGIDLIDLYEKKAGGTSKYAKQNYEDCPPEIYSWYIRETMREAYRTMADGSWGICWFAFEPNFEPTYQAIKDAGFFVRRVPGLWIQPTGAAYNANLLLASAVDSFFYFRKGQVNLAKPGTTNTFHSNLVPPSRKTHPTERPIELYEQILSTFAKPGAKVLVPFAGSGASLLAAANLCMIPIGFDLRQDHRNAFVIRVHEGDIGHYKSLA